MNLDQIIEYFRYSRAHRAESVFASDRVFALLDAYDRRGEEIATLEATIGRFIDQWERGEKYEKQEEH